MNYINWYEEGKKYIPGGVNSPVRSFKAVAGEPVLVEKGIGARIYDQSGREYVDHCLSWGALIMGHAHPQVVEAVIKAAEKGTSFGTTTRREVEFAQMIVDAVPTVEQVRLVNSGTEAVMSALRLARAFTGRDKILKFDGAYHGHADYLLVKGGSGQATLGQPDSAGVPADFIKHTIVAPYNNLAAVAAAVQEHSRELAAIIVEPVAANCGVIPPAAGFLEGLRDITEQHGVLLVFDEVITGFRLARGGAQQFFGVAPDLTCLGKIVGGGMPLAAFGGRREIMQLLAPQGAVYQAGTLAGNPVAVAAGLATLKLLQETAVYSRLQQETEDVSRFIEQQAAQCGLAVRVNRLGSMFSLFFMAEQVVDYAAACRQNTDIFKIFYHALLDQGVYFSPSAFEANFLSLAHTTADLALTKNALANALKKATVEQG